MKRILFLALLIPTLNFAQEKEAVKEEVIISKWTVSGNYNYSDPSQFGASIEYKSKHKSSDRNTSRILNLSGATLNYDNNVIDVDANGFVIELGTRTYIEKGKWDGFYGENFISYGNLEFDETITGLGKWQGQYSYWSIINPNIGYKFIIGKGLSIDPSIGANWKWEVRGKGDVDNKYIDNFVFRAGIKIGYNF